MASQKWSISGQYMESCNCDYLCPCIYTNPQGPATHDHCTVAMAFRIDEGRYGDVPLEGLKFAFIARSRKVMADGGWAFACVVDATAGEAQRAALTAIASGEAGGRPGIIRQNLVSDFRGVAYEPITFEMDGMRRAVTIPGILSFEVEGVASRTGNGEPYYIDNVVHTANTRLALARSKSTRVKGFGLDLEMIGQGNNGHFAPFRWSA